MATMPISYSFSNATTADALQVNQNFLDVKGFVESALVQVDGTVQLPSAAIADGAVTSVKIADSSVTSAKIVDNSIVNADINSAAAIADSKLATIATAGKVSNSATTATNNNTASAIVARDGSGNFNAGTITANLNGTASFATNAGSATSAGTATSATTAGSCSGNSATATYATTAGTANSVAVANVSGMKQATSVTTLFNSNGSFAIAHGLGVTPSNVVACNGDYGAQANAVTVTTGDSTYIYGRFVNTTANTSARVNWIAFY